MTLNKFLMSALLAGTLGAFGCSTSSGGGTAGAGGDGTGGTAGSGGGGGAEPCTEGLCVEPGPKGLCEDAIALCNSQGAGTPAQCDEFGNVCCELDCGGAGGDGGPSAADVCEFCDTDNQTAIDDCVSTYNECQGSVVQCVVDALTECRTGVVNVFITSGTFDGNLGGLAGADDDCTNAASNATPSLSGTWTAWLSVGGPNAAIARDRIRDGEYQLLDGTVVADDKAALTNAALVDLKAPINLDEDLATVPSAGDEVWTATDANGGNPGYGTCQMWLMNVDTERGRIGRGNQVDAAWTDEGGGNPCDEPNRLYCFADATSN